MNSLKKSFSAGVLIGISGLVYLSCSNKVVGVLLFSFGLLTICELGLNLFTGMAGFAKKATDYYGLILIWLGNYLGVAAMQLLCSVAYPEIVESCRALAAAKMGDTLLIASIKGLLCGVMMFLAVYIFRTRKGLIKYLWIVLCVSIFILSGFEHSIADMFYLASDVTPAAQIYIFVVSIANLIGAKMTSWLFIGGGKTNEV